MDRLVKGIVRGEPLVVAALDATASVDRARLLHGTLPTASAALGRTLAGAALLSVFLKEGQRVMIQVSGDGPLRGILAESDWRGRIRGYVKRPRIHLGTRDGKLDVGRAVGAGTLTVLKDLGLREHYRGTVPLQTGEIASDLAYYLTASEQIPAAVSLGVYVETDNSVRAAGGFLLHPLPGAGETLLARIEERLRSVAPVSRMLLDGFLPQRILEEVAGAPVDMVLETPVAWFCPCTRGRVLDALVTLGAEEIREMADMGKPAEVTCEFCRRAYVVGREELLFLLEEASAALEERQGPSVH